MKTGFYTRLAVNNIRKNGGTYLPYILTCIMTVMMFYIVKSLSLNPGIKELYGEDYIGTTMELGTGVIELFAFIFLFYTNSFLMKRRKKEFGLFNILGMEKKHLSRVLLLETLLAAMASIGVGLLFGIALDKAMFLLIIKAMGRSASLGFFVSVEAIRATVILFCIIFLLIYLKSVYTIQVSKPIELLHGSNVGEKEPKANWVLALVGTVMLGAGYYLALTIKNPVVSIVVFFVAVFLVMIATYLLFTSGSIVVLKLMRKNQKFYYKTRHFISVSGMIYRMKRNAVGLANICILSTMVLVMVSSTTCLMVCIEDIVRNRYPNEFNIYSRERYDARNTKIFTEIRAICQELDVPVVEETKYRYVKFYTSQREDTFITDDSETDLLTQLVSVRLLIFIPLSDYNASTGENRGLGEREMLFFSNQEKYMEPVIRLFGMEYSITERLKHFFGNGIPAESNITTSYYCIVRDEDFDVLVQTAREEFGESGIIYNYYGFVTTAGEALQQELQSRVSRAMAVFGINGYMETRLEQRDSFLGQLGGFFFLGVFLGILFLMAAVLIIYYKQISEGYEDRERFVVLQKVGMTQDEIKSTIRSQVLMVFFLPLAVAGIHMAVAFPLLSHVLEAFSMVNGKLYLACTVICFLVFVVFYMMIYGLTARTYYRIVSG